MKNFKGLKFEEVPFNVQADVKAGGSGEGGDCQDNCSCYFVGKVNDDIKVKATDTAELTVPIG